MHRMGHGSMRAALVYQHATTDRDRAIADALGALVDASKDGAEEDESSDEDGDEGTETAMVPVA
jgi:hypothetical protein